MLFTKIASFSPWGFPTGLPGVGSFLPGDARRRAGAGGLEIMDETHLSASMTSFFKDEKAASNESCVGCTLRKV